MPVTDQVYELRGELQGAVILGIDPSLTETGIVALGLEGGCETWLFCSKFRGAERLLHLRTMMSKLLTKLDHETDGLTHIVYEGYAYAANNNAHSSGELGGVFKTLLLQHYGMTKQLGYPTIVPPTKLKKFVTGNGASPKDQMLLGVYKKWQQEFSNHNLSDAYGLARVGLSIVTGETGTQYEADVISSLGVHTEWQPPPSSNPTSPSSSATTPKKRNSESQRRPVPQRLRQHSATPSTMASGSPSERSAQERSTKPSRQRRSPVGT